jgi:hypothetical protein
VQALLTLEMLSEEILTRISHIPLRTYASTCFHIPDVLWSLPALQTLILVEFRGDLQLTIQLSCRTLKNLQLTGIEQDPTRFFTRALELCADNAQDLSLCFKGSVWPYTPISFSDTVPFVPSCAGAALTTLRLRNFNILTHPSSGPAQLLQRMPSLQHLHVNDSPPLPPASFNILPPSLHSLTLSAYGHPRWGEHHYSKDDFVIALSHCLSHPTGHPHAILHIVIYGLPSRDSSKLGNLAPLEEACDHIGIGLSFAILDPEVWECEDPEIRIFCRYFRAHAREYVTETMLVARK